MVQGFPGSTQAEQQSQQGASCQCGCRHEQVGTVACVKRALKDGIGSERADTKAHERRDQTDQDKFTGEDQQYLSAAGTADLVDDRVANAAMLIGRYGTDKNKQAGQ